MKSWPNWKKILVGAALAAVGLAANRAHAASTSQLNIDVTVSASASVTIDAVATSTNTGAITWSGATRKYASGDNANGINRSSATVSNNGNLTERWYLSTTANSLDVGSAGSWSLNGSSNTADVGPNQYSVQAVFASTATTSGAGAFDCPGNASTLWSSTATMIGTAAPVTGDTGSAYGAKGAAATAFNNFVDVLQTSMNVCPDTGCSAGHYQMYGNATLPTGSGTRALCWYVILPPSTTTTDSQIVPIIVTAQAL